MYAKIDKYKICINQVIAHDFRDLRNRNTKLEKILLDFYIAGNLASFDFTLVGTLTSVPDLQIVWSLEALYKQTMLQYKLINGYTDIDVNADVYSTQQNILHFVQKNACSI